MKTYPLFVTSPDGMLYESEVVSLSLRGTEGDLAILSGHIPFITAVKPCTCRIVTDDGDTLISFETDGGLLTVTADKTTFFTGKFSPVI